MKYLSGYDIGGTKCAAVLGKADDAGNVTFLGREQFATKDFPEAEACLHHLGNLLLGLCARNGIPVREIAGLGISCGGPLDARRGIVQSPPNLPGWDEIPATEIAAGDTGIPAKLENDANACALAEWRFGAGRGCSDMIFLTFGTGLGAGIIANGQLLGGACGMAGECGPIRLAGDGPVGYGKRGSFEGFCSGGGLAQLGKIHARKTLSSGKTLPWCPTEADLPAITAKSLAEAAAGGDSEALAVYRECGTRLGEGLSILIDLLNPQRIVIGSIFSRAENLLRASMESKIAEEALPQSAACCQVVPAQLGERIGDYACLAIGDVNI